jgi:hypothetical protein
MNSSMMRLHISMDMVLTLGLMRCSALLHCSVTSLLRLARSGYWSMQYARLHDLWLR